MQRLRGAVGTALTWAIGWCVAGVAVGFTGFFGTLALRDFAVFAGVFAGMGFVGGAMFSLMLTLIEGRKRFDQLSIPRFALWGAVGGVVLQGIVAASGQLGSLATLVFFTLMASGSAAGTLALARIADDRSLSSGDDIEDIGLTKDEIKKLLGP